MDKIIELPIGSLVPRWSRHETEITVRPLREEDYIPREMRALIAISEREGHKVDLIREFTLAGEVWLYCSKCFRSMAAIQVEDDIEWDVYPLTEEVIPCPMT